MKVLSPNWLTEGLVDVEYKKYILLDYLQAVEAEFKEVKLYPWLNDLLFHYNNLQQVKQNRQLLQEQFPKEISHADFTRLSLVYRQLVEDDQFMQLLEEIIGFSLPALQSRLEEGKELYNLVEDNVSIAPVGLTALYKDQGYFFLLTNPFRETEIYRYQITLFDNAGERYRGIHVTHQETRPWTRLQRFESLKVEILKSEKQFATPATWLIEARMAAPRQETLLPVVKRCLVKYLLTQ